MKTEIKGWVVISRYHPKVEAGIISDRSFSFTRSQAIQKFTTDSAHSWEYWKRHYNFRCVRAVKTISIINEI